MDADPLEHLDAPFWDHVEELRKTLLRAVAIISIAAVCCFIGYTPLINFLTSPFHVENGPKLLILGPLDGIAISLKVSFWTGAAITSPLWLLALMQFIAPALKTHEKKLIIPFFILSMAFIALGFCFAYYITIPLANTYLGQFNEAIGVNMWSLEHYLNYTLFLLLANGIAFELFVIHLKIVSKQGLIAKRRHAIVAAFILGALLTPPDILTQFMLAIPLILLYEGLICYSKLQKESPIAQFFHHI
jgi:sec-independent protein translocase protein TatC